MNIFWEIGILFLGLLILGELYLQLKYTQRILQKKRRIRKKIDLNTQEKKYSEDLVKTHSNVFHRIGYALIPCSNAEFNHPGLFSAPYRVHVNAQGIREEDDVVPEKITPNTFVGIFLGDSVTFGSGVPLEETFTKQTQMFLKERGVNALCLNFGVGGYSVIESLLSVFYRRAEDYRLKYIIFNLTIKSLFDASRCNDPLTGYHMEARQKSFILHALRVRLSGGKLVYLHKKMRKFDDWCRTQDVRFIVNLLPALYQNKILSLQTKNEFSSLKYTQTLDFMEILKKDQKLTVWDFTEEFLKYEKFGHFYRTGVDGNSSELEVHYSKEGNQFLGQLIAQKIYAE
ncbi:MAG: SGNH/GDSL hydrolase family protein [Candidatus Omnitrophica bacterium]|nr:SGNH/GDSL hydrolase family protein [Candidatus Omnitrophota bacterium]